MVTIKNNGTYTSTASTFGYSGTYTISGNSITAKSDSGDTFVVTVTISGDKMTWNG
ncbi:MAG: lipocalin family protein [Prevotella sp.]|nr:lipocalin family protein [Prevotella sp.]